MNLLKINERENKFREENKKRLEELAKHADKHQESQEKWVFEKWWDWLMDKVSWIRSSIVNLMDVPEKIGWVIWDVLARAEKYIWRAYVSGSMDCSMFLSKIFCAWQWVNEHRLWTSWDFAKYEKVGRDMIRCWDVIYQAPSVVRKNWRKISKPGHVELIVTKPYVENGITYVNTIWSSSDKNNVDPMFDAEGKPIIGKNWVWYRKRQIAPHPRHNYTYHRPPYEQWANMRA